MKRLLSGFLEGWSRWFLLLHLKRLILGEEDIFKWIPIKWCYHILLVFLSSLCIWECSHLVFHLVSDRGWMVFIDWWFLHFSFSLIDLCWSINNTVLFIRSSNSLLFLFLFFHFSKHLDFQVSQPIINLPLFPRLFFNYIPKLFYSFSHTFTQFLFKLFSIIRMDNLFRRHDI